MKNKFILLLIMMALALFFGQNIAKTKAEDYTIPVPNVTTEWVGSDADTYAVMVFWQMPESAEPDAYGFIIEKEKGPDRERAAIIYPEEGFDNLSDSGYYYDEAVAECDIFNYYVKAYDKSGVESDWGQATVTVDPRNAEIQNVQVSNITSSSATISWDTNVETSGKITYTWEGQCVGGGPTCQPETHSTAYDESATHHEQTLSNLNNPVSTGTKYQFQIIVFKKVESECGYRATGGYFTLLPESPPPPPPPPPDTTPPSVPSNLNLFSKYFNSVSIGWNPAVDDRSGAVRYKVYRGDVVVADTDQRALTDTGLTENTIYTYKVSAYDVAGNNSDPSASLCVTTPVPTCIGVPQGCSIDNWQSCPYPYSTQWNACSWYSSLQNYSCYSIYNYDTGQPYLSFLTHQPPYPTCGSLASCSAASPPISSSALSSALIVSSSGDGDAASASVEYGTRKEKYTVSAEMTKIDNKTFTYIIPNPKPRTYHYRIASTDKDHKTTYSDDKTLKYGHWFPRFWGDLFGNFWDWLKSIF